MNRLKICKFKNKILTNILHKCECSKFSNLIVTYVAPKQTKEFCCFNTDQHLTSRLSLTVN